MVTLIAPAMKHYYQIYNAITTLVIISIAYAGYIALLGTFVFILEEASLTDFEKRVVTLFTVTMIIPILLWLLKELNITICPIINWLAELV